MREGTLHAQPRPQSCIALSDDGVHWTHQSRLDSWPQHYPWIDLAGCAYFRQRLGQAHRNAGRLQEGFCPEISDGPRGESPRLPDGAELPPHRYNIDRIIGLCVALEADFVELATCQFYGWAELNRVGLSAIKTQPVRDERITDDYRAKLEAQGHPCKLIFVTPDYYEERPKACMNGWENNTPVRASPA